MFVQFVETINGFLSNYILVFLLLGIGIWYTFLTKFVQVRCFKEGVCRLFSRQETKQGSMSSFQALTTAIAAQVGTGNIIGSAGAILVGGPGAIFWMWMIAFFGMATVYAEAVLAIQTRKVQKDGRILGGPVYYIRKAFPGFLGKGMAAFFAIAIILALGFMGCMVQANSIGSTFETAFSVPSWIVGVVLIIACAIVFFSDVSFLAKVVEKIVPIMAGFFLTGCIWILMVRHRYILSAFQMIFTYAFCPQAILGGSVGHTLKLAISQGAKRGLFSNEAGMGSTPHAHAQANVKCAHDQGVVAIVGVFIDTFVVLTLNALVIISTMYTVDGPLHSGVIPVGIENTNLAQLAFGSVMSDSLGSAFVAVCLLFFAFSTILSWNMFGKINVEYLFGKKAVKYYSCLALGFIFLGTMVSHTMVWELSDLFNNLMVIPNTLALFVLCNFVTEKN